MSAEHWQEQWDIATTTRPVAEVVKRLPDIVWEMRLAKAGDTSKEGAALRIYDILDSVFTTAWGDE